MPDNVLNGLPILSIVITLAAVLGGLYVFRKSQTKQLGELQERLINTYKTQNEVLEKELTALRREATAMRLGFKHLGISIEISGDDIILTDASEQPKRTHITTIHSDEDK